MIRLELRTSSGDIFAFVTKETDTPWIYVQLVGKVDLNTLKKTILKYTNVITKYGCPYILSDNRVSKSNWFEINHWIEYKWAPIAIKAGLQYIAHVNAPMPTSQLTAQDLASRILGLEFKSFDSMEDAESWLKEKVALTQH